MVSAGSAVDIQQLIDLLTVKAEKYLSVTVLLEGSAQQIN